MAPCLTLHNCRQAVCCLLALLHFNMGSIFITLTLPMMSILGESHEATNIPVQLANLTQRLSNVSVNSPHDKNVTRRQGGHGAAYSQNQREFPTALVVASSVAAVCIIVFFIGSYYWHTHQLDSRARKLAIQLAADSEHGMHNCDNCKPQPKLVTRAYTRAVSESSQEPNMIEALNAEEEPPVTAGSDGGRSSVVVSESDTADLDDIFDSADLPAPVPRGSRAGSRSGRGAHRKWSRSSRKSSGPATLDGKRDSAVTDKDILTHFAGRRHSTFFI